MIVVDTSVWIEAFRNAKSSETSEVGALLDDDRVALVAPVRLELLLGANKSQEAKLRRVLSALPCWYPDLTTWRQAERWIPVALSAGHRFGFATLLIAAIAHRHKATIWSLARDFQQLEGLGFASLFKTHV